MKPVEFSHGLPRELPLLNPGAPLWQRVPTRDDDGRPLADFMMLVPRLREQPQSHIATHSAQHPVGAGRMPRRGVRRFQPRLFIGMLGV